MRQGAGNNHHSFPFQQGANKEDPVTILAQEGNNHRQRNGLKMQPAQHLVDHINGCILPFLPEASPACATIAKVLADANWFCGGLRNAIQAIPVLLEERIDNMRPSLTFCALPGTLAHFP